jgi:cytoskeletal protein RodZ
VSDQQPRAEWIFPEQPKKRAGRVWLIIGIVVAALLVIGVVLFFVVPREGTPGTNATPTPTVSATATPSATPSAAPSPSPSGEPSEPITTPPPVPDPDMSVFVGHVQPWLDDATTGLGMVANMSGQDAAQVVDSLQGDADRLSNVVAPSSISSAWYDGVSKYSSSLNELRSTIDNDGDTQAALSGASSSLQALRAMVGL